jgi:hypothetical protein
MDSILSDISQPKPMLIIVTPSPKLTFRINGDCTLSSNTELCEYSVFGSKLNLPEVLAFLDILALSKQAFFASAC